MGRRSSREKQDGNMQAQAISMTISSVISSSSRVLHIFFPFHRKHMKQMIWITSVAHTDSQKPCKRREEVSQWPHFYRRPPGCCSSQEPEMSGRTVQHLTELASHQLGPSPLFTESLCFTPSQERKVSWYDTVDSVLYNQGLWPGVHELRIAMTVNKGDELLTKWSHSSKAELVLLRKAVSLKICVLHLNGQLIIIITYSHS